MDNRDKPGLDSNWRGGHGGVDLASVGVMEWARIVFAEPRVLEGVRVINFVCVGEEEPEVSEGFPRDEFELGKDIWVCSGASEVGHKGFTRCFGKVGRSYRSCGVIEAGWHC